MSKVWNMSLSPYFTLFLLTLTLSVCVCPQPQIQPQTCLKTVHEPLQWFFPKNAPFTAILGIFSTDTYAGIGKQFVSSLKML